MSSSTETQLQLLSNHDMAACEFTEQQHRDIETNTRSCFPPQHDDGKRRRTSTPRSVLIITTLAGITIASSMTTGLLVVQLPVMAHDLGLSNRLLLWPASIYGLTSGCSMLIVGAVADIIGSRPVFLLGCLALGFFMLGSGLSQSSTDLIICRGGQGIAVSMCLPTAMSLLTLYFPLGKRRNIGFAIVGAGQPLGYSIGLFLGGFFVDSVGWRYGWYMSAAVSFAVFISAIVGLPRHSADGARGDRSQKILFEIDWLGALIASACLGMLSYVLAVVSTDTSNIRHPTQIALLCIAGICPFVFAAWISLQERRGKPALISNDIWKNLPFSSVCLCVFFSWAIVQTVSYSLSLYFQKIQHLSAIQTSVRFIPDIILGIALSVLAGLILHRVSAYWIVLGSLGLTAISPLLMAIMQPHWSYWYAAFWAVLLSQVSVDVLFVVSALVITASFPEGTQALASAVFNTISQFGTAVGLAIMSVISSSVTQSYVRSHGTDQDDPISLLEGYRASYWACFAMSILACGIGAFGLRGVANKGMKKD
ncbi:hypothetical protein Q7P37_000438 [Cladosporium fusiforme]